MKFLKMIKKTLNQIKNVQENRFNRGLDPVIYQQRKLTCYRS